MKKILKHLVVCLVMFFAIGNINAEDYKCKYKHDKGNDTMWFTVKNGKVAKDDVGSTLAGGSENIQNWSKKIGGFSAEEYAKYNVCPPFALVFEEDGDIEYEYYVADLNSWKSVKKAYTDKKKFEEYYFMNLIEGPTYDNKYLYKFDDIITIKYYVNNEHSSDQPKEIKATYKEILDGKKIENIMFSVDGYNFLGWHSTAYVGGSYYVAGGNKSKILFKSGDTINNAINAISNFGKIDNNTINFYAQWKVVGDLTPIEITEYGLGKSECERREFMWVGSEEDGYCNIDNLKFVYCGDAKDIPSYVPRIVSLIVNLLKIATPIILIFVSIISLLKAVASTNEDEIKKAQKGLTRKIIAAVLVFFVIQIVQFVIMKVADTTTPSDINNQTEANNVSSCLSCFLNNDCSGSTYYRYYLYGEYHYYRVEDSQEITLFNE